MKLPSIANDDQPGPIFRRHNSTGGDFVQSVSICRPWATLSRFGPRKPGQIAGAFATTGAGVFSIVFAAAGVDAGAGNAGDATGFAGAAAAGGAAAGGSGVAAAA